MSKKERGYARACHAVYESTLNKKEASTRAGAGYRQFLRIYDRYLRFFRIGDGKRDKGTRYSLDTTLRNAARPKTINERKRYGDKDALA